MLALEEATLSTDLQQGYALKSLTGRESHLALPYGHPVCSVGTDPYSLGAEVESLSSCVDHCARFKLFVFLHVDGLTSLSYCSLLASVLP